VNEVNTMSRPETSSPDVKPEIVFIFELIDEIRNGRIRIPRFQRPFVWRRDQMLDLLDSIRKRYPIGSLLVWTTESHHASTPRIGPVDIPPRPTGSVSYVLDGQQRLSTLAGTLLHDGRKELLDDHDPDCWTIWYNLEEQSFEHLRDDSEARHWHFPIRKLLDTFEFLGECRRLMAEGGEKAQTYVDRIQQLSEIFKSYKMPVIRIESTDLGQAVEIFTRLNSKGQRISTDQIVSALAYEEEAPGKTGFSLAAAIDGILEEIGYVGFGGLDREFILRSVLAVLREDIYQKDWTRIFTGSRSELKAKLPGATVATKEALDRAIRFLHAQDIRTDKLLPYSMQVVLLAVFFHECPEPSEPQRRLLERWLWVSAFTGWFASANPSRIRWLIEEFREMAKNPQVSGLEQIDLNARALPFPSTFDWRSSRVRSTVLSLLDLKPQDAEGKTVEEPWNLIADDKPNAVSHIVTYPSYKSEEEKKLRSSPANRIVNIALLRGQAKKWLLDLDPSIRNAVLESHGIPPEAFEALRQDDFQLFLEKRLERLEAVERDFMQKRRVTPPVGARPEPPPIDTGDG